MANQSQSATRTIEEIRKTGIDQDTLQKIQQDKAEIAGWKENC
jgi:hypothetical protein